MLFIKVLLFINYKEVEESGFIKVLKSLLIKMVNGVYDGKINEVIIFVRILKVD